MKKFLKKERRILQILLFCTLLYCGLFYILYSKNIYKDFFTIIFVPTILVLVEKTINAYLDTSNKPKLMNDAKLFYDSGVITDEEFNEKRKYIRTLLEDIDYVERTTELPKNQNKKVDEQNNTLSTQLEELKSENKDLREEINIIKQQNEEIIKLLKESNQKNDCVLSKIAKKIKNVRRQSK